MIRRAVLLLALLGGTTSSLPAAPATPTVDDLVARHVAARGGVKKLRAIHSLRQTGHVTAGPNRDALVTREIKLPGKTRFEFTVQGVTAVFVSDGRQGWKVSPFEGELGPEPLSDEVVAEAVEQTDLEGPLVDWKAKGNQVRLLGREEVAGREAYKLEVTLESGAIRYDYLDAQTSQLVRTEATRQVRGRSVQMRTTFGDHKKAGGVSFPRRVEVEAVGRPQRLRVVVDRVELNPEIPDSRFEAPSKRR